jgi:hypothetical protein
MSSVLVKTPFNLWKDELSFWQFFEKSVEKIESLEDLILWKMINEWELSDIVDKSDIFNFLDKKIK